MASSQQQQQQQQQQQNGPSDVDVRVRRRNREPRIEFAPGTTPPRVARLHHSSYLNGSLYVGDVVVAVNGQQIHDADGFYGIVRGDTPERLHIRVQRDNEYQFLPDVEIERTQEKLTVDKKIKWRSGGRPLGVEISDRDDGTTIVDVEAGAIATGHLQYGDVITQVDGAKVVSVEAARKLIFTAINENSALTLRIERSTKKPESKQARLPPDIKKILGRQMEFFERKHRRMPAAETEDQRVTMSSFSGVTQRSNEASDGEDRLRVHLEQHPTVQTIPADNNKDLKKTPPRPGSREDKERDRGK